MSLHHIGSIASSYAYRPLQLACGAAFLWAFIFAALSAYWALGGTVGLDSLGEAITEYADEPLFILFVWLTAVLKLGAGGVAIALCYHWKYVFLQRAILVLGFFIGGVCLLYGLANLAARLVMALGLIPTPEAMQTSAAFWHLVLWNPWWVLGGIFFLVASWMAYKQQRSV